MEIFRNSVLPFAVLLIVLYGLYKKIPVFSVFVQGAQKALKETAELLPVLTALSLSVSMLTSSGSTELITELFSPLCRMTGFPPEVIPLCLITPLSGSGSVAVLEDILRRYSPDSSIGRLASVIAGASETTFYTIAVYYGSVGITGTRHTVPCALTADLTSYVVAAFLLL